MCYRQAVRRVIDELRREEYDPLFSLALENARIAAFR